MYNARMRYTVDVLRFFSCAIPVLRSTGIFAKAVWGNVFSGRSACFAGYALAGLVLLFGVSLAEASSGRSVQQQAGDGKAGSVRGEDAHDGVSQTARIAGRVPCVDGEAAGYPCKDMDLLAFVPREEMEGFPCPSSGDCFNDIWGWADPVTGVEYALLGRVDGVAFFNLRDPENPFFVGMLPMTPGSRASFWRDIKVVNDHAVIVGDNVGSHGMQVFDLSQLRDVTDAPATFDPTALYDAFGSAHNVVVNEETDEIYIVGIQGTQRIPSGFACGAGPHIVDMSDPAQPTFAGCYNPSPGRGYTHDAQCVRYRGPDTRYSGNAICFSSDENGGAITDVTDPASPEEIGLFGYPNTRYTHQGWLTGDHRYLFVNDELDEGGGATTRTLIFDVQELDDPVFVGAWHGPTTAIDHNLYIHAGKLYEANYTAGLRVMDISYDGELSPDAIREVAYFDVYPGSDRPGFTGAWSSYPWFGSGIIAVSSIVDGLYILAPSLPGNDETGGTGGSGFFYSPNNLGASHSVVDGKAVMNVTWTRPEHVESIEYFEYRVREGYYVDVGDSYFGSEVIPWTRVDKSEDGITFDGLFPEVRHLFSIRSVYGDGRSSARWINLPVIPPLPVSTSAKDGEVPTEVTLGQNHPNPFNPETTIRYALPQGAEVRLAVYDLLGHEVAVLVDGSQPVGQHTVRFDGGDLPSGSYVYRLQVGEEVVARTMTLVK